MSQPQQQQKLPSPKEVCSTYNKVPISYLVNEIRWDLRRMAVALVGIPYPDHPAAQWMMEQQQQFEMVSTNNNHNHNNENNDNDNKHNYYQHQLAIPSRPLLRLRNTNVTTPATPNKNDAIVLDDAVLHV